MVSSCFRAGEEEQQAQSKKALKKQQKEAEKAAKKAEKQAKLVSVCARRRKLCPLCSPGPTAAVWRGFYCFSIHVLTNLSMCLKKKVEFEHPGNISPIFQTAKMSILFVLFA